MNPSPPPPAFNHPSLGSFVAGGDIWTCSISQDGRSMELSLAGDESAPHEVLLSAASGLLARFSEVKELALDFLTEQEDSPRREDFICHGMELLREDCPNHFSLSFILFGDLGGSWRVEFEDGAPEFLTRDD